jgi:hypothetical protein
MLRHVQGFADSLTSGISTVVTRIPGTLRPPACAAACFMLSISSFPNLVMVLVLFAPPFQHRGQLANRTFFLSRQIFLPRLRINHQQIEWPIGIVKKNKSPGRRHACQPLPAPAHLADTAGAGNDIARFGMASDVVDELIAFTATPDLFRLAKE